MDFEWDEAKAATNAKNHGVTFWEATEVFGDELSSFVSDPDHSHGEERFLLFGRSLEGKSLGSLFHRTSRDHQNHFCSAHDTIRAQSL
jgi:uncharacterized DUF497 family protein